MLFINPPFSNYISLPKSISIMGSYTLYPRHGLIQQIIKTLRYDTHRKGWINKIGLRNPGIDYAIKHYNKSQIISIALLNESDIKHIINKIPDDMNIELNVSCPNTKKHLINNGLQQFLNPKRKWCVIKLPPLSNIKNVDYYYSVGFRQFHCCNTLRIKEGGLSGPELKKYTLPLIKNIKQKYPNTIIIGGGGIRNIKDIDEYKKAGADHFSVSTLCFSPISFLKLYYFYTTSSS